MYSNNTESYVTSVYRELIQCSGGTLLIELYLNSCTVIIYYKLGTFVHVRMHDFALAWLQ